MFLRRTLSDNICFILIALTALCLRFWLLISAKSIWGDEWFSIYLIEKPLSEIPALSIFTSNHPPGYLLILWAWAKLFGLQELSLRSMSHAFNLLMIVGVYKLAKELFNRKTAILTALFVGICPYFLHLSNEIRSYSTLTCLSVFATYFFFKAHNNPSRIIWKILYVVFATITLYTEHYGWLWLFGITAYLTYKLLTQWRQEKQWIWIQGLVFLFGIPSVIMIVYHALFDEQIFVRTKLAPYRNALNMIKKTFGIYWHFVCGPIYSMLTVKRVIELAKASWTFWVSFLLTLTMIMLCLKASVASLLKHKALFALIVATLFFPVFFLLLVYPIRLDARYLCWSVPLFYSLVTYAITSIHAVCLRRFLVSFFLIYALSADIYMIRIPTDPMHKENYREMVRYSFQHSKPNDAIAGTGTPTTYYSTRIGVDPNGTFFHSLKDAMIAMEKTQFDHVWLMQYIDMKPEITERVLTKIDERFHPFHYSRSGNLIRFGGTDGLTAVQIYKKDDR